MDERIEGFVSELEKLSRKYGVDIVPHGKRGIELRVTDFPCGYRAGKALSAAASDFPYMLIFTSPVSHDAEIP